ncbi:hypothetical protein EVG20_g10139, partial [Dentipellis fragilis]
MPSRWIAAMGHDRLDNPDNEDPLVRFSTTPPGEAAAPIRVGTPSNDKYLWARFGLSSRDFVTVNPSGLAESASDKSDSDDEDYKIQSEKERSVRGPSRKKRKRTHGRTFGVRHSAKNTYYINPDDYEQKYPVDGLWKGLDHNARIWKVYLDETKMLDDDMVGAWRDTVEVLLVFAGLFSAVVSTFVVQTSQSLQPDYSQVSAILLTELIDLQRTIAN